MGAKTEGVLHIAAVRRSAPYDSGDNTIIGIVVNPLQNLEATHYRHFQVKDEQVGERMGNAVRIRLFSLKICQDLCTIFQDMDWALQAICFKCTLEDKRIIWVIFRNNHREKGIHLAYHRTD